MKNKCKYYATKVAHRYVYSYLSESGRDKILVDVGYCMGTKEREECSCCGDEVRCNFYPAIKEAAIKRGYIQEAIDHFNYGITHDMFSEPVTSYAKLAVEALKKQLEEKR